jgi:hypothetical protein
MAGRALAVSKGDDQARSARLCRGVILTILSWLTAAKAPDQSRGLLRRPCRWQPGRGTLRRKTAKP